MRAKRERSWLAWVRGPGLFGLAGQVAHLSLIVNQPLILEREPTNPVDCNAIIVRDLVGAPVGYVAREVAASVAPVIDSGTMVLAKVAAASYPLSGNRQAHARALLWVDGMEGGRLAESGAPRGRREVDHPMCRCVVVKKPEEVR